MRIPGWYLNLLGDIHFNIIKTHVREIVTYRKHIFAYSNINLIIDNILIACFSLKCQYLWEMNYFVNKF